ncbi:MAG: GumC family protein [Candidatus Sulfotelmatobacter sp.]
MAPSSGANSFGFTLRDIVAVIFRQKRVLALSFAGITAGVILAGVLLPAKYKAETELLVKHDRMDPIVTPEQNSPIVFHDEVTEEELNSEVQLIQSEDVLREVVLATGLNRQKPFLAFLRPNLSPQERTEKAVRRLLGDLQVEPVTKTDLIRITYSSTDPQLAAAVLSSVDKFYLEKHLAVHHPAGQLEFFEKETAEYGQNLAEAEQKLKQFAVEQGGVAPDEQRDLTLQKLNEFNASLQQTREEIASIETRVKDLEKQAADTPGRVTTQTRKSDNPQVMEQLKSALLTLELKRTELLTKYQPSYRPVQEVEKQIAETRAAIAGEESSPLREETTDQNPTFAWITSELAKSQADLSGLRAREAATQAVVNVYLDKARRLDEQGIAQQDLLRAEKTNEENYLLYQRKREEARIADALDRNRILNIAVAQEPVVPSLPSSSRLIFGLIGTLLAGVVSVGLVFAVDYMDQSFRTPSEVMAELNIPVLAAIPSQQGVRNGFNGNGNGNGNGGGHRKSGVQDQGVESIAFKEEI